MEDLVGDRTSERMTGGNQSPPRMAYGSMSRCRHQNSKSHDGEGCAVPHLVIQVWKDEDV